MMSSPGMLCLDGKPDKNHKRLIFQVLKWPLALEVQPMITSCSGQSTPKFFMIRETSWPVLAFHPAP